MQYLRRRRIPPNRMENLPFGWTHLEIDNIFVFVLFVVLDRKFRCVIFAINGQEKGGGGMEEGTVGCLLSVEEQVKQMSRVFFLHNSPTYDCSLPPPSLSPLWELIVCLFSPNWVCLMIVNHPHYFCNYFMWECVLNNYLIENRRQLSSTV